MAQLAGVSVDYYIRLERGHTQGISETVLEAVARALRLDDTERAHLFDLAQPTPARPPRERNFAYFVFLDEAARTLYADWERADGDCVAMLRLYAGRHPDDPRLVELIGELSVRSNDFRRMWGDHDVLAYMTSTKRLHHPIVGDLDHHLRHRAARSQGTHNPAG